MKITRLLRTIIPIAMGCFFISCVEKQKADVASLILWYNNHAEVWEDALPLGNGRIGAMVFGYTDKERIQLNDDSLWAADVDWDDPEGTPEDLARIRGLLIESRHTEADEMMVEKFSRKDIVRSHQTLGELYIDLGHFNITEYRRELDIAKALATVSYKTNGEQFTRRVFASHPHQVIVVEIETESEAGLNGKIRLERPEDVGTPTAVTIASGDDLLVMRGEVTQRGGVFDSKPAPIDEGVKFETCLKVRTEGGRVAGGDGYLELKNVKRATLLIISNSSWYYDDYRSQNKKELQTLEGMDVQSLLDTHVSDHRQLFDGVDLNLTGELLDSLPTDVRLNRVKAGSIFPACH